MECTSRASSPTTTRLVSQRVPDLGQALVDGAAGQQGRHGARGGPDGAVVDDEDAGARRPPRSRPGRRGRGPRLRAPPGRRRPAKVASSATVVNGLRSRRRSAATAEGKRKNESSASRRAASACSVSSGARGPSSMRRLITRRSRSGSIGGLVTWAKRCRRKWSTGGAGRPAAAAASRRPSRRSARRRRRPWA